MFFSQKTELLNDLALRAQVPVNLLSIETGKCSGSTYNRRPITAPFSAQLDAHNTRRLGINPLP